MFGRTLTFGQIYTTLHASRVPKKHQSPRTLSHQTVFPYYDLKKMVPYTNPAFSDSDYSLMLEHIAPRRSNDPHAIEAKPPIVAGGESTRKALQRRSSFSSFSPQVDSMRPVRPQIARPFTPDLSFNSVLRSTATSSGRLRQSDGFRATARFLFSREPRFVDSVLQVRLKKKIEELPTCIRRTRDALKLVQENILAIEIIQNGTDWQPLRNEWEDIITVSAMSTLTCCTDL